MKTKGQRKLNSIRSLIDLMLEGRFKTLHYNAKGKVIGEYKPKNGICNPGKDYILNTMFNSATQIIQANWFIGLIDNASFSALAAADTMASHAGWIEFTAYSQSTRVAWGPATTTTQAVTNATPAQFDITGSAANVNGIFVVSNSTKSGTSGLLWCSASYSSVVPVNSGDQLKSSYSISC